MEEKRVQSSKKKLFYVLEILRKYSDDQHPITAQEIVDKVNILYGIKAERKSVYRDIDVLRDCGYNIIKIAKDGFCLADRSFEIAEIRLLNDAILSAKFITPKKTKEISRKLCKELSVFQAEQVKMQTYFDSRIKFTNEHILYAIDAIHTAIYEGKKIKFGYYRHKIINGKLCRVFAREHIISPYALIWSDDKYYLVGNYEKYDNLSHYRLDRMENVIITDEKSRCFKDVCSYKDSFDVGDYAGKTFHMYSGTNETLELICSNDILDQVIDKLGENVSCTSCGKNSFRVRTDGYNSEGLTEWLMILSHKCYIVSPESLRKSVTDRARAVISMQSNKKIPPVGEKN